MLCRVGFWLGCPSQKCRCKLNFWQVMLKSVKRSYCMHRRDHSALDTQQRMDARSTFSRIRRFLFANQMTGIRFTCFQMHWLMKAVMNSMTLRASPFLTFLWKKISSHRFLGPFYKPGLVLPRQPMQVSMLSVITVLLAYTSRLTGAHHVVALPRC